MDNPRNIKPQREDYILAMKEIDVYTDIMAEEIMDIQARAEKYARMRITESVRVGKLMSHPAITVMGDCPLAKAAHMLVTKRISALPVVDANQQLAGIITEADFFRTLGMPSHHPAHNLWHSLENLFSHHSNIKEPGAGYVAELMTRDVITISPDHTLHDLLEEMKKKRVKRVVVCDEKRHVAGMITRSDVVRIFFDNFRHGDKARE